mgnify:CR=1 FL=1
MTVDEQRQMHLLRKEDRTPEERRQSAIKAGKASGEARRRKRDQRKILLNLLESVPDIGKNAVANLQKIAPGQGKKHDKYTVEDIAAIALLQKAMKGDVRAYALMLEIIGEDVRTRINERRIEIDRELTEMTVQQTTRDTSTSDAFMKALGAAAEDVFHDREASDVPTNLDD